MSLTSRFRRAAVTAERQAGRHDESLRPAWLTRAAVAVLPVDAASLGVHYHGARLPLGSSDAAAAHAEQVQFTLGEGPCLEATASRMLVAADETRMGRRRPVLADAWIAGTPFRSMASVPVDLSGAVGALDLYSRAEQVAEALEPADVTTVAALIGRALGADGRAWLASENARGRQAVWVAVGMVMERWGVTDPEALARLRGHAFGNSLTLDDLARELLHCPERVEELRP